MEYSIAIEPKTDRHVKETRSVPFGKQATEHMFLAEYRDGLWHEPRIVPFANLQLLVDPLNHTAEGRQRSAYELSSIHHLGRHLGDVDQQLDRLPPVEG